VLIVMIVRFINYLELSPQASNIVDLEDDNTVNGVRAYVDPLDISPGLP
jgi:hypothetical protein